MPRLSTRPWPTSCPNRGRFFNPLPLLVLQSAAASGTGRRKPARHHWTAVRSPRTAGHGRWQRNHQPRCETRKPGDLAVRQAKTFCCKCQYRRDSWLSKAIWIPWASAITPYGTGQSICHRSKPITSRLEQHSGQKSRGSVQCRSARDKRKSGQSR